MRCDGLNAQTAAKHGIILPLCTGMAMALVLSSLREAAAAADAAAIAATTKTAAAAAQEEKQMETQSSKPSLQQQERNVVRCRGQIVSSGQCISYYQ